MPKITCYHHLLANRRTESHLPVPSNNTSPLGNFKSLHTQGARTGTLELE